MALWMIINLRMGLTEPQCSEDRSQIWVQWYPHEYNADWNQFISFIRVFFLNQLSSEGYQDAERIF